MDAAAVPEFSLVVILVITTPNRMARNFIKYANVTIVTSGEENDSFLSMKMALKLLIWFGIDSEDGLMIM